VYAVNISDLLKLRIDALHPVSMVLVPLLTDKIINCEPELRNGHAVLVNEVADERWFVLVRIIRKGAGCYPGLGTRQLRLYRKNGGGWERM
jgi:hypothetical protein